jgi:hypothetical protein
LLPAAKMAPIQPVGYTRVLGGSPRINSLQYYASNRIGMVQDGMFMSCNIHGNIRMVVASVRFASQTAGVL